MSENKNENKDIEPENRPTVGLWTSIGLALGALFGLLSNNLLLGIAIGVILGGGIDVVRGR